MNDLYLWLKAGHVISVIAWMAGMLYLPRLFVYHCGVAAGSEASEMLKVMERRLLRAIINPAMLGTFAFGGALLFFFLYAILSSGFAMADTHVLFKLTPVDSPARTLVAAAVSVGVVAALVPFIAGIALEYGLRSAPDRLLVYHIFFTIAATVQATNWWPARHFGLDHDQETGA